MLKIHFKVLDERDEYRFIMEFYNVSDLKIENFSYITTVFAFVIQDLSDRGYENEVRYIVEDYEAYNFKFFCEDYEVIDFEKI